MKTVRAMVVLALAASGLVPWAEGARAEPVEFKVELFLNGTKEGISRPVDIAWVPGTQRLFFSEEDTGKIWIVNDGRLIGRPCVTIGVKDTHDKGLTGLVLHPDFSTNRYLYAYYTANTLPPENRVTRFTVENGRCRKPKTIIAGLGTGIFHQGGQMVFDEDKKLFITTGENNKRWLAQDRSSPMGKVLRLNDDGTIPEDNPFQDADEDPRIWSYGHRNGFGLAYVPGADLIIETENGPTCDDELNIIEPGANYGWGVGYDCQEPYEDRAQGEDPVPPVFLWEEIVAPTDPWWFEGRTDYLPEGLYVGDYNRSQLHMFEPPLDSPEDDVIYNFSNPEHRIVDVSEGPDNWLYVVARENIYRLVSGDSEKVRVNDALSSFQPKQSSIEVGGFVRWVRDDTNTDHNIVERHGLFRMRSTDEAIDYTKTFSAGRFPYECTLHLGMTGVVKVAPSLLAGPAGLPFRVRWATNTTDTGATFDVDYKVNSGRWKPWKRGSRASGSDFGRNGNPEDLDAGSKYSFRARSAQGGDRSGWSPVAVEQL